MKRRQLLSAVTTLPLLAGSPAPASAAPRRSRVRPGDEAWPSAADWAALDQAVGGRLFPVRSPLNACVGAPPGSCDQLFARLRNPYFLGDEPGLTQSLGWVDGWTSRPSAHAIAVRTTADVVAAVGFARNHDLRMVVKGGGHAYQGTSNAPDSLLVWTQAMTGVTLHDQFVATGCAGRAEPQPAVTVEAGAIWGQVYDAVTTRGGRYVQGGGCLTVGVAGLVQSGGFGSFSKAYGTAAASLLEAEIVTADGTARTVNACREPDLFWALRGGGGGSLGVVTRLTLRTHPLPDVVGAVFATITAGSDTAFRRLLARLLAFCRDSLLDPHWGEQLVFRPNNVLAISMLFQGLDQAGAEAIWQPFLTWIAASPEEYRLEPPTIVALEARRFWDPAMLAQLPGVILGDDRPGAPAGNIYWTGNRAEAAQLVHACQSAWLPASLLRPDRLTELADALHAASRHWTVSLHLNKGLAGAPAAAIEAARDTASHPAMLDAFALAISGAEGPPAFPGIAGHEPDIATARRQAARVGAAMAELRAILPSVASYLAEGDYFDPAWRESFWGPNYARLRAVKDRYDPDGLFIVHHGVGSERWSPDGFTRLS